MCKWRIGYFHDDEIRLQLPELISSLLSHLHLLEGCTLKRNEINKESQYQNVLASVTKELDNTLFGCISFYNIAKLVSLTTGVLTCDKAFFFSSSKQKGKKDT